MSGLKTLVFQGSYILRGVILGEELHLGKLPFSLSRNTKIKTSEVLINGGRRRPPTDFNSVLKNA